MRECASIGIDLSSSESLELDVDLYSDLESLDKNQDFILSFDELKNSMVSTPDQNDFFIFEKESDISFYNLLISQQQYIKNVKSFSDSPNLCFAQYTDSSHWFIKLKEENMDFENLSVFPNAYGVHVIDQYQDDKYFSFLLLNTYTDHFYTVLLPKNPNSPIYYEIGGNWYNLTVPHNDPMRQLAFAEIVGLLIHIKELSLPEKNKLIVENQLENIKLIIDIYLQRNPKDDMFISEKPEINIPDSYEKRVHDFFDDKNPVILSVVCPDWPSSLEVKSEKSLNHLENTNLITALNYIPGLFAKFMDKLGRWKGMSIEIMEDDLFDYALYSTASTAAMCFSHENRIVIKKSSLMDETLLELIVHEMCHNVFRDTLDYTRWADPKKTLFDSIGDGLRIMGDSFLYGRGEFSSSSERNEAYFLLKDEYKILANSLKDTPEYSDQFPAVSYYATSDLLEFWAETFMAYVSDDLDQELIAPASLNRSMKARGEVREKHPRLFVAFVLAYSPGSPFFGDLTVLNLYSTIIIESMLNSEHKDLFIGAHYRTEDIIKTYTALYNQEDMELVMNRLVDHNQ